ncbi:hypothetical protein BCF46_0957 [Litoreibacter meonggei]|uniref:General secretion pathway protein K n=1 Tax=Litoreibacter meonggei TaxID=1049199 RepID=A0A497X6L5_9RHOB|nr:hypothetical protein BCF46_0957 [Litoreibacter meonggei]
MTGNARSGYALVVVLFSLVVLTLIFGTASTRTLTHIQRNQTNRLLAERLTTKAAMAELLLALGPQTLLESKAQVWQLSLLQGVTLQPATGLVDLNTAHPALLSLLLEGYGLPDTTIRKALEAHQAWRRHGRKLLRVSDFHRVTGLTADMLPEIENYATIYSGRTGIAATQAPTRLLQHLLGSDDQREALVGQIDPALVASGSVVNLHMIGETGMQAVLHLGGGASASRVLGMK